MTVDELLDRISGQELTDWMVYEQAFGPLGPTRGDVLAAQISATIVNMLRDPSKGSAMTIEKMRLRWPGEPEREVDPDDQALMLQQLAKTLGGEISFGDASEPDGPARG